MKTILFLAVFLPVLLFGQSVQKNEQKEKTSVKPSKNAPIQQENVAPSSVNKDATQFQRLQNNTGNTPQIHPERNTVKLTDEKDSNIPIEESTKQEIEARKKFNAPVSQKQESDFHQATYQKYNPLMQIQMQNILDLASLKTQQLASEMQSNVHKNLERKKSPSLNEEKFQKYLRKYGKDGISYQIVQNFQNIGDGNPVGKIKLIHKNAPNYIAVFELKEVTKGSEKVKQKFQELYLIDFYQGNR